MAFSEYLTELSVDRFLKQKRLDWNERPAGVLSGVARLTRWYDISQGMMSSFAKRDNVILGETSSTTTIGTLPSEGSSYSFPLSCCEGVRNVLLSSPPSFFYRLLGKRVSFDRGFNVSAPLWISSIASAPASTTAFLFIFGHIAPAVALVLFILLRVGGFVFPNAGQDSGCAFDRVVLFPSSCVGSYVLSVLFSPFAFVTRRAQAFAETGREFFALITRCGNRWSRISHELIVVGGM